MFTKSEMETIINFTEAASDACEVCTHSPKLKAQLAKLAKERPDEVQLHPRQYTDGSVRYIVPRAWYAARIPVPRKLTDKQLAAARAAAAKGRAEQTAQRAKNDT